MVVQRPIGALTTLAAVVFTGTAVLWLATPWGIGVYTDSLVYIGSARNILAGNGFKYLSDIGQLVPVNHYPPLYPLLIALFSVTGVDALDGARWVSLFFCAANALLAAALVYRATLSYGAMSLAALLSWAAFPMVYINSQALTEPPFIFLTLLGFGFLARYLKEEEGSSLYWAAFAVGLACMVRYVGIANGLTGALVILLSGRHSWPKRFVDAAAFSVVAALPIVAWFIRNYLQAGNTVNRTFGFHFPAGADLLPSLNTIGHWLLPINIVDQAPWFARLFLLFALLLLCALGRKIDLSRTSYPRLMLYCAAGYCGFLYLSLVVCDASLFFDTRTLALPYMTTMIVVVSIMTEWLRKYRPKGKSWCWFTFDCAVALLFVLQLVNGIVWLRLSYFQGIGFGGKQWRESELLRFARTSTVEAPLVSNAPDFIYALTGRRAVMIPYKIDPISRQSNRLYEQAMMATGEQLKQPHAAFIYFDDDGRWYLPSIKEVEATLPLKKMKAVPDGAIYQLHPVSFTPSK